MSLIDEPVTQFGFNLDVDSVMTFSTGITLASKGNALDFANIVVSPTMAFSAGKSRVSKGNAMAFSGSGSGSSESNAVIPTQTWIG
tara:strand:- start:325 stop:582 length:258 start_codon:yes stop_codon:yes gene_type:complete